MGYRNLLVDDAGPIATIALNRPRKRNALSHELMGELLSALEALAARPGVRVVVLRGEGPAFSAGHDFSEMVDRERSDYEALFNRCAELMATIQRIPQPVIAQVHGIATAAGCQLVATCDLAVAEEGARFATSGVRYGLFCVTPGVALTRNIGRKRALEMLLTGDFIDARTAAEWGLINRVVPASELEATTRQLAEKIVALSPTAIALGKTSYYRQVDLPVGAAYEVATEAIVCDALSDDAQEGMSAFLEKRTPLWGSR